MSMAKSFFNELKKKWLRAETKNLSKEPELGVNFSILLKLEKKQKLREPRS
jgi:hypothetical protein